MIPGCKDPSDIEFKIPRWVRKQYERDYCRTIERISKGIVRRENEIVLKGTYSDEIADLLGVVLVINPLTYDLKHVTIKEIDDGTLLGLEFYEDHSEEVRNKVMELYYDIGIGSCKTDLEKEKAVNDYLVDNCVWDPSSEDRRSHTLLGVLLDSKGVCISFAHTTTVLLNCFGVECHTVTGSTLADSGEDYDMKCDPVLKAVAEQTSTDAFYNSPPLPHIGHAWNYINIDGRYRHLDVTFNCSKKRKTGPTSIHGYFNLTTDEIMDERRIRIGPCE